MTLDQFFYLLLGASFAGAITLAVWLLKDRLMIFGNMVYWGTGYQGVYDLPKTGEESWPGHICYQHVVLQVRAMGDRVLNTRIQFPADDDAVQVSVSPRVPFDFSKNRPGELHIPLLQSGKYTVSYGCKSNMRLSLDASSVFSDNARTVQRAVTSAPMDSKERKVLFLGLTSLVILASISAGFILGGS
ncbi:MAG: hypothetical protein RLW68_14475 [Devosia marina]|uniref:hypothetical protein n=1 Tax=Devosia marina TaxID=2683198 RepID=UPI0032F03DF8